MKSNIIGVLSHEDTVTIKVSALIDLLVLPTAISMQSIRSYEDRGCSENDMHPNREFLSQVLLCALSGKHVHECLTTDLLVKGVGKNQIGWARDYLVLLQQSISGNGALTTSKDDPSAEQQQ